MTGSRPPPSVRAWTVLVGVLLLSLAALDARAAQVVVVLSAEAAPYREAEKVLKTELARQKHAVETVLLASLSNLSSKELAARAEVMIAVGTDAGVWLHSHLPEPAVLIYCMVSDPDGAGLTTGRIAHGVRVDVPLKDQLGVISEAIPAARVVGMLYKSGDERSNRVMELMRESLPEDWRLEAVPVDKSGSVAEAIDALLGRRVDVIWTAADPSVYDQATIRALLLAALRKKVPVFGFSAPCVRAGALLGTAVEPQTQGEDAASILATVLDSAARPAARIHRSPRSKVLVNMAVVELLGIRLSRDFVERASQVSKTAQG